MVPAPQPPPQGRSRPTGTPGTHRTSSCRCENSGNRPLAASAVEKVTSAPEASAPLTRPATRGFGLRGSGAAPTPGVPPPQCFSTPSVYGWKAVKLGERVLPSLTEPLRPRAQVPDSRLYQSLPPPPQTPPVGSGADEGNGEAECVRRLAGSGFFCFAGRVLALSSHRPTLAGFLCLFSQRLPVSVLPSKTQTGQEWRGGFFQIYGHTSGCNRPADAHGEPHTLPLVERPESRTPTGPAGLVPLQRRDSRAPRQRQHLERSVSCLLFTSAFGSDCPRTGQAGSGDSGSRAGARVCLGGQRRAERIVQPAARSGLLLLVFGSESEDICPAFETGILRAIKLPRPCHARRSQILGTAQSPLH